MCIRDRPKTQRKHNAARLFFICCLIEYIARQTKNLRSDVVNALGKRKIKLIFDSSSGWYCFDNMEQVCVELIGECRIAEGNFDNVGDCRYPVQMCIRDRAKAAILNTACSGKFSSDRTIEEYVKDIWHLEKVQVEL